ncbi:MULTISPECIES: histidine phosphatase family protein [Streptomycetaceae]|uniref:Phosphatase n=1 Tax=Streptantibioticus cattleyicolor (strain ATCC 35852 / DSM 46488 / JCM 4925 / NBRC 14057 / NRRL 8057) TaxID=1003195 RepID=F8JRU6_STREN|nr:MULTISPECIES: histidine phosphatase family protein [Streptomycetaceae]AEW97495.1 phosphatase [Streptantibioticus cattleyicolor NRRL 8057 = DSM 46488]MYS61929.1 MSMEG_4193 family putative phosphomutase [Streptomyces sp. SID5468]CCB77819.1 putative phosphatase [Streptantibioticus cattleyicolor NRRL 8057 = DSM 46488]
MPIVILARHGRSTANADGVLAGWSEGVGLDERGGEQAAALATRLAALPLAAVVTSPLQRCRETVQPLLDARPELPVHTDDRVGECHYGDWTGRKLADLAGEPLWKTVQQYPSGAVFPGPGGESVTAMQQRAVAAIRDWNERIERDHGPDAVYLVCSHGDIIKSVAADALGLHLDLFQRLSVEPCSVTAIRYTPLRPFLLRLGDTGEYGGLVPRPDAGAAGRGGSDAVVGGATGTT